MFWVLLFAAAALLALVVLVAYGVWLAHRLSDLWSEVRVVLDQLGQLSDLVGQVGASGAQPAPNHHRSVAAAARLEDPLERRKMSRA